MKNVKIAIALILLVLLCACSSTPDQITKYLDLGEKYLVEMNYEEALVAFEKVIELDPKNFEAYEGVASVYEGWNDFAKAAETLKEGMGASLGTNAPSQEQRQKLLSWYDRLAREALENGDEDAAMSCYSLVLELDPGNPGASEKIEEYQRRKNEETGVAKETDSSAPANILSLGGGHTAVVKSDKSLWTWGSNDYGQLGDGTTEDHLYPIKTLNDVQAVSLGTYHSAVIKTDGSLWMWGVNYDGQLGDGTIDYQLNPIKILDDVQSVSLGAWHSAAIKTDGSLWMWGSNSDGQLGDGTNESRFTPTKIMDDVQAVSLGPYYSAAIKTDGSLWMWGSNYHSELGNNSKQSLNEPVKILDNVRSVSLGDAHTAAIKKDGSLWMWGNNESGQLGNGTDELQAEPVKILDDVRSVSLGSSHSAALKKDGSLWIWGENFYGEQGYTTSSEYVDTPVKLLDDVQAVSLGPYYSAAIKTDGSLWMWGENYYGQLGIGTTTDQWEPKYILNIDSEKEPDVLKDITGHSLIYAGGSGAWNTTVTFEEDGLFTGRYYDWSDGEGKRGDGYPNGTEELCEFSGRFIIDEKVDDYTYVMKLDYLNIDGPKEERFEDGLRIIPSSPYGIEESKTFILFLPGCLVDNLPQSYVDWVGVPLGWYDPPETLPFYGLYNVEIERGFWSTN